MRGVVAVLGLLSASQGYADTVARQGGDIIEIRKSSEGHKAEVYYSNSRDQNSGGGLAVLEWEGIVVEVYVQVLGDERVTVRPMDPNLIAVPAEADVPDGDGIVIQIMLPMF